MGFWNWAKRCITSPEFWSNFGRTRFPFPQLPGSKVYTGKSCSEPLKGQQRLGNSLLQGPGLRNCEGNRRLRPATQSLIAKGRSSMSCSFPHVGPNTLALAGSFWIGRFNSGFMPLRTIIDVST
ncbi:unnamed protein product [Enterobius vermicularis]|uniref:Uncharacterized protein n=1 Tax=Enterobius vermicularis TaxID=51028 RepID=A0A0N4UUF5_ENTVE|nr:unnamed protein product [Enterobius vermicularis]